MDKRLKHAKQTLRAFMRRNYTDERLAMLLAHAQEGKLRYESCCCFIGVATADHALQSDFVLDSEHYGRAGLLPGAGEAESAFCRLSYAGIDGPLQSVDEENATARRRLIPMIKAEIRRRDRARAEASREAVRGSEVEVLQHL